ncbi:PREDICTED: uncharacterized protein LOC109207991 [Nicotiana attenuata]|uniref:uncharacterized protein LOC109207991 n=1 Tax=Nicotiana attenuata TaxID=49451 RepID=UPI0009059ED8|nr:PREDICTED: uncharacterized protein LOC109207991 [Nicotiana attenuata]
MVRIIPPLLLDWWDCQNAEGSEGGHLARAFLLLNLCELGELIDKSIQPEEGGTEVPQGPVVKRIKVSAAIQGQTQGRVAGNVLAFSEEDFETLSHPHNDALVISFLLNNIRIKHVLVDPGSSANIIRSTVIEQLGLLDRIIPTSRILNGFNMASEATEREIILPINISDAVQDTRFHVIKGDARYNALPGRLWIHNMKAVPSTLLQMMKFPAKDGIRTVYASNMR